MKNVIFLLRLNIKLLGKRDTKQDLLSLIFSTLIFGLVIGFAVLFFINLLINFENMGAEFELLVFLLFFVMCIQIAFGVVVCLKSLFVDQNDLLSKFPFRPREIFLSRLLYSFFVELLFGLAF